MISGEEYATGGASFSATVSSLPENARVAAKSGQNVVNSAA
jgi:hypothetical protein